MRGASFLQSWEWGEFQQNKGKQIFRHALADGDTFLVAAQWVEEKFPGGFTCWLAPRGPVTLHPPQSISMLALLHEFFEKSHMLGSKAHPIAYRIEPPIELCYESMFLLLKRQEKLVESTSVHPADTRVIALDIDEETLLASMSQKTRYNIHLAERKGVTIKRGKNYIDDFVALNHETTARDGFVSHPDRHYRQMVASLPDSMIDVYVAEYEGRVIASNLVIHFGNTTTYLHGASSSHHRSVMAPHLLQWQQIKDAKARGSRRYDLYGIAPEKRESGKKNAWAGITRFKNGFGGIEKNYVGTWDLPTRKLWYSLYSIVRSLRH